MRKGLALGEVCPTPRVPSAPRRHVRPGHPGEAGVVHPHDLLPLPTINWAENASYLGKAPPPDGTKVEEPPAPPPPTFSTLLSEEFARARPAPPPEPELVANQPGLKGNLLPDPKQTWEAIRAEDRKRLGL